MKTTSPSNFAEYKLSRRKIAEELARIVGLPIVNKISDCSDGSIELSISGMFVSLLVRFKMDSYGNWEVEGKPIFNIPAVKLEKEQLKEMVRFFETAPWAKHWDDVDKYPRTCQEEGCDKPAVSLIGSGYPLKCNVYCFEHGENKLRRERVANCPNCGCEFCASD